MSDKAYFVDALGKIIDKHKIASIKFLTYRSPGSEYDEEILVTYHNGKTLIVSAKEDDLQDSVGKMLRGGKDEPV